MLKVETPLIHVHCKTTAKRKAKETKRKHGISYAEYKNNICARLKILLCARKEYPPEINFSSLTLFKGGGNAL